MVWDVRSTQRAFEGNRPVFVVRVVVGVVPDSKPRQCPIVAAEAPAMKSVGTEGSGARAGESGRDARDDAGRGTGPSSCQCADEGRSARGTARDPVTNHDILGR